MNQINEFSRQENDLKIKISLLEQEKNNLMDQNNSKFIYLNENINARLENQKNEFNRVYNDLSNRISLLETEKKILLDKTKSQESILNENENLKFQLMNKTNEFNRISNIIPNQDYNDYYGKIRYNQNHRYDPRIGVYRSNGIANNSPVFLGPRGGQFRINSNDNVTYLTRHQKRNGSVLYD